MHSPNRHLPASPTTPQPLPPQPSPVQSPNNQPPPHIIPACPTTPQPLPPQPSPVQSPNNQPPPHIIPASPTTPQPLPPQPSPVQSPNNQPPQSSSHSPTDMQQRQFHRSFQTSNRQRISLSNEFASLIQPEDLLLKYPKLNNLSRIGALSAKLAREVYFGKNIMSKCTVYGCRDRPPLPKAQLEKMKIFLMNHFKFSSTPEFENHWRFCVEAVNHSCSAVRKAELRMPDPALPVPTMPVTTMPVTTPTMMDPASLTPTIPMNSPMITDPTLAMPTPISVMLHENDYDDDWYM